MLGALVADAGPARREHLVDAAVRAAARAPGAGARRRRRRPRRARRSARWLDPPPARAARARRRRGAAVSRADRVRRRHREPARAAVPRDRRGRAGLRAAAAARAARPGGRSSAPTSARSRHERGAAGVAAGAARSCSTPCRRRTPSDFDGALAQTIFFYVPFALLFALLVRDPLDGAARRPLPDRPARARGGVRRDRLRRVRQARAAAQPEGHQLQPVRVLLPRQLAVLRPEHLRALPRDRDARRRRACCCGAAARRSWPAARRRSCCCGRGSC